MSRNDEIATLLEEFADLLETKSVVYKPSSYRHTAENTRKHPTSVEELAEAGEGTVRGIDRIGDAIAAKIVECVEAGRIEELKNPRKDLPVGMAGLTNVEGVGPKTVGELYEALGVSDLDDLEAAARDGGVQKVKGFDAKTEANILDDIKSAREATDHELLGRARPVAGDLPTYLDDYNTTGRAGPAGSMRRWRGMVGGIDVLTESVDTETVIDRFLAWDLVGDTIEAGEQRASVRVSRIRVNLRVVEPSKYGTALQYLTGSKGHNVHLRSIIIDRGLKMNEYGIFDTSDVDDPDDGPRAGTRVTGDTETSMYAVLDLPLVPSELHEDTDEIEHAAGGNLPDLLAKGDLRGDLHTHTGRSDGDNSIAEMVTAATERGYDYHAVTDHATGPGMVGGIDVADDGLLDQIAEIRTVADDADIAMFTGVGANIDAESGISVADDVPDQLGAVVTSPHSTLSQDHEATTERLVTTIEHPMMNVLGRPTDRLINQRPGLPLDCERFAEVAIEHGVALELNASPYRLNLNGETLKTAVEAGAAVVIDTGAHRPGELDHARHGIYTARHGWVETADILNARSVEELSDFLA